MQDRETFRLDTFSLDCLVHVGAELRAISRRCRNAADFYQSATRYLYETLVDADGRPGTVLLRFFKTSSFDSLSPDLQEIVRQTLPDAPAPMKCLTLQATAGLEPEWNDVLQSRGHRAIPLPSLEAVELIPMIAQLMRGLGIDVAGLLAAGDSAIVENERTGVFHVPVALNSPYIPAQDHFVKPYGVASVVGFGDVLPRGDLFAVILFARVPIGSGAAALMSHLSLSTKVALLPHLRQKGDVFEQQIQSAHEQLIANYEEIALGQDRALRSALDRAMQANRVKSEFLANMSHEIRTPLTAVLGYAELLIDELSEQWENARVTEAAKTIQGNAEHLLGIVNDILDVSKIEAGKLEIERLRFTPLELIEECLAVIRPQAAAKQLRLACDVVGQLPTEIESDPTRLRQILLNLLSNAVKFTKTGSITLRVETDVPRELLHFEVVDTGIGLTAEQLLELREFKPFHQADGSTTRRFGGTGLGLCISHSLSRLLGGNLTVESELNRGSRFCASIATGPLAEVAFVESDYQTGPVRPAISCPPSADSETDDTRDKRILRGNRILVAEDGIDNQRLVRILLEKAGAQVDVVENGRLACERIAEREVTGETYDIVLMDMQMPVMDGYTATRKLRDEGYRGPVVALTAHAMSGDREKCLAAGCDDYLTKPIRREKLFQVCRLMTRLYGSADPDLA